MTTDTLAPAATLSIDIWSDIQCPWCYIGKRRLETALRSFEQTHPDVSVGITYHSFELSPDTPADYVGSTVEYLSERKGIPTKQVERMLSQVTELAAAEGLSYHLASAPQINTRKAHEALHFAAAHGRQAEFKERLMHAHFTENRHTGKIDVLAQLGTDVGLDAAALTTALEQGQYIAAVDADIQAAQQLGIQGVPFFVLQGKYGISGAQSADVFTQALSQVAEELRQTAPDQSTEEQE